jgi:hypothetical protein
MNKNLYFIPILSRAAEHPEPEKAFREALSEIERLGLEEEYREGYAQFLAWMGEVSRHSDRTHPLRVGIRIEPEGESARVLELREIPGTLSLPNVKPGKHRIVLQGGLLLWEGEFTPEQLLWAYAFEGQDLPAAAATPDSAPQPTSETVVLDGELILRTYPGPRAGRIEIEVQKTGTGENHV